jgi:ABC-type Fe3+-hydroxamate transport system substrate-binding protein
MRRIGAIGVVVALVALACGGGSGNSEVSARTPRDKAFPVSIRAANGGVEVPRRPRRIVSLSPTATEMLFAIGAGAQVVAVDDQSDYPAGVPTTELSGFEPNVEAIAEYEPDLVVASSGGSLKTLGALDIPLLVQPAPRTFGDVYSQFEQLGTATGHKAGAEDEVATMKSRLNKIVASAPRFKDKPTYYHELDNTYFSVTSDTFIGRVYGLVGLRNIADQADGASTGYPQLSAEYIIRSDPDLIFLADTQCCNQTPARVARRPGWDQIEAVEHDSIVVVGDDVSSRWGPRIVDFLHRVVGAVRRLAATR